jgi:hypothetical protein
LPRASTRSSLRAAAPALAGYLAVRLVGLLVLWLMARQHGGVHVSTLLGKWDGRWFVDIARNGYDTTLTHRPNGSVVNTNIVFFPGYPYAIKAVAATGVSELWAGIAVAWAAGLAAAWGIFAVGRLAYDARVGVALAVLWGVVPHAIVESMVYSEALFTALAAWCLYALLQRRWVAAGVLCLLAGTTRAAAGVLVAVVMVAAALALVRRRDGSRPLVALVLAPLGLVGYLAWVATALGRWDGWSYMQDKGWHLGFDAGRSTWHMFHRVVLEHTRLELYEVSFVLVASIVLLALLAYLRPPWPLLAYAAGLLALTLGGQGYYHSKSRFLLPAFPLLLPVAVALARTRLRTSVLVLAVLALASAWYGAYLLLDWPASP